MSIISEGLCGTFLVQHGTYNVQQNIVSNDYSGSMSPFVSVLTFRTSSYHYKVYLGEDDSKTLFECCATEQSDVLRNILVKKNMHSSFRDPVFVGDLFELPTQLKYPKIILPLNAYTEFFRLNFVETHMWFDPIEYWLRLIRNYCSPYVSYSNSDIALEVDKARDRDVYGNSYESIVSTNGVVQLAINSLTFDTNYQGLIVQPWLHDNIRIAWLAWFYYFSKSNIDLQLAYAENRALYSEYVTTPSYLEDVQMYANKVSSMLPKHIVSEVQEIFTYPAQTMRSLSKRSFQVSLD